MNEEQIKQYDWKHATATITIDPNDMGNNLKLIYMMREKLEELKVSMDDCLNHYGFYLRMVSHWQQMSVWTRIRYAIKGWLPEIWYLPK